MDAGARIYVAGHTGLVGSALCRALVRRGYAAPIVRTHAELDLTDRPACDRLFQQTRPEYVFLAAAMAGGIARNQANGGEMIRVNLAIQTNVIDLAMRYGVRKLIFLASACSYPRDCPQPIKPEAFLTGPVEPTSEPFAVAKIAGIRMCQAYHRQYGCVFIPVIPATTYGPGDHFGPDGHVASGLLERFHVAAREGRQEAAVWGTGKPRRELLYVDDLAEGLLLLMDRQETSDLINLGGGEEFTIAELAERIAVTVGFSGRISFDTSRPDGMPRRLLDSSAIRQMGWRPSVSLSEGLKRTYDWYRRRLAGGEADKT